MEKANVTLVNKKDSMEPVENYRLTSLLCILGKVLKRFVCITLFDHVKQFISSLQHDFLRNCSYVRQLLSFLITIGHNMDKNI